MPPDSARTSSRPSSRPFVVPALVLTALGAVLIVLTVAFGWGSRSFAAGVFVTVVGVVTALLAGLRLSQPWRAVVAVVVAVVLVAAAWLVAVGPPGSAPRAWEAGARLTGVTGILDNVVYSSDASDEPVTAREVGDGRLRWQQPESYVVMVTPRSVLTATQDTLSGHDPRTGRAQWTLRAASVVGVAQDGTFAMVNEAVPSSSGGGVARAVVVELSTGRVVRREQGMRAVTDLRFGGGEPVRASTQAQSAVLLIPSDGGSGDSTDRGRLVRIADGRVLMAGLPPSGRIIDGVLVGGKADDLQDDVVTGWSIATGGRLWQTHVRNVRDFVGAGPQVVVGKLGNENQVPLTLLNVRTGRLTSSGPPSDWLVAGDDVPSAPRSSTVWLLVVRGKRYAMWQVGSGRLVPIEGKNVRVDAVPSRDGDVWGLTGVRRGVLGDRDVAYGMTGDGRLSGPFPGSEVESGPGVLAVSDSHAETDRARVYPIG